MLAFYLSLIEDDSQRALFGAFYQRYFPRLFYVAKAILRRDDLAEEAVQTSVMKVLEGCLENFLEIYQRSCDESFYWFVTTVKNTSLDMKKKEGRTVPLPEDWRVPAAAAADEDPDYLALVEVIQRTPELYRQVLEMRFLAQMDYKSIARELHLSVSAVASRIKRGRELLVELLEEEGYVHDRR